MNIKILLYILKDRRIHVPSFFIISFYFTYKQLVSFSLKLFLKRVEKLIIPYFLWPIIFFIFHNYFLNIIFRLDIYSFKALKNQLIWGILLLGNFGFNGI